ncbi:MAG: glycosyltransferase family A protein [Planctomycetaceae bacterium]
MQDPEFSIIIPARNEERLIGQTIDHVLAAGSHFAATGRDSPARHWELIVVDNGSTDGTQAVLERYAGRPEVSVVHLETAGAARARNAGRARARGRILLFVDADTMIPPDCLRRIADHCHQRDNAAGITSLGTLDGGFRARLWWGFWNSVRRLPLAKAKAMPALMFCTAGAFDTHGPFDEDVAIGEEWPILAGLYRRSPEAVVYDRSIVARSSSRRMDRRPFGYSRTFLRYVWAILHRSGRINYGDKIR